MTTPHDRRALPLSDEQIDALAEKLAERVAEKAYAQFTEAVGRSVLRNLAVLATIVGAGLAALWHWHGGDKP